MISLEDASLTKKGIVKLSSATDSDSEALAATPKAVHAVMDEVQT
ncbi:phage tail protein, partial [Salmonella enterica]|nr:phage tail protein [Salmonella enterica subsp. enterica serovar Newport]ECF6915532.1 phage tail protein [Salmonella enterica subsp. enterica]EGW0908400.1 phage tail protein [Salmonella enterica]EHP8282906.1 tail fiber protein [Salmonella enterica]EJE4307267.1 tail fiber protein [Salmonella enterica]